MSECRFSSSLCRSTPVSNLAPRVLSLEMILGTRLTCKYVPQAENYLVSTLRGKKNRSFFMGLKLTLPIVAMLGLIQTPYLPCDEPIHFRSAIVLCCNLNKALRWTETVLTHCDFCPVLWRSGVKKFNQGRENDRSNCSLLRRPSLAYQVTHSSLRTCVTWRAKERLRRVLE